MLRGEVWWTDLPPPLGRRPVVLLTRDAAYRVRRSVTVAQVTTCVRGIATEVVLGPEDDLPRSFVINLDNINTVPTAALLRRISTLSQRKVADTEAAVHFALGLVD